MKKFIAITLFAATAALSTAPANAQMSALKSTETAATTTDTAIVHKTGRRGRFAAGLAIGIVGDAGVRANAQQPRLFVGMISVRQPSHPFLV